MAAMLAIPSPPIWRADRGNSRIKSRDSFEKTEKP